MTLPIDTRVRFKHLRYTARDAGGPGPVLGYTAGYDALGYCIVRLDRPITYGDKGGLFTCDTLTQADHNLEVLEEDAS